jgi:hypothetical protein
MKHIWKFSLTLECPHCGGHFFVDTAVDQSLAALAAAGRATFVKQELGAETEALLLKMDEHIALSHAGE